jgi:hypothetical protein
MLYKLTKYGELVGYEKHINDQIYHSEGGTVFTNVLGRNKKYVISYTHKELCDNPLTAQLASATEERDLLRKALVNLLKEQTRCFGGLCYATFGKRICGSRECIDLHIAKAKEG